MRSPASRCSASWRCGLPLRRWRYCRSLCCGKETREPTCRRAKRLLLLAPRRSSPAPRRRALRRVCVPNRRAASDHAGQGGVHHRAVGGDRAALRRADPAPTTFAQRMARGRPGGRWAGVSDASTRPASGARRPPGAGLCVRLRRPHPAHRPLCPALRPAAADPGIDRHGRHPQRCGRADLRPAMGSRRARRPASCSRPRLPVCWRPRSRSAFRPQRNGSPPRPTPRSSSRPSRSSPGCSASC